MPLSGTQVTTIIALERTGASLSSIGITLIFVSYYLFKRLRTIPNLFIVFASVANIGASIACLIGYDGILIGEASALCQAQAFMLEIDWSELRIYTYYLPIWICILCSILIYFAVGYHVFHQRNQLRNLTFSHIKDANEVSMSEDNRDSAEKVRRSDRAVSQAQRLTLTQNLTGRSEDWQVTAVTEVQITTGSPRPDRTIEMPTVPPAALTDSPQIHSAGHAQSWHSSHERVPSPVISHTRFETMISSNPPPPPPRRSLLGYVKGGMQKFNAKLQGLDPVKLAYLRTSFIFAISILVTWTPSSINRVNDLVNPGQVSFGLNVATAIVLPLQGVWNAVIYFMTSWTTVKEEYRRLMHRRSVRRLDSRDDSRGRSARLNIFRGHRDHHFDPSRLERGKRPRSGQVSEYELAPPAKRGHGNVRAMRGSF
ncbi:hypothetical protein ACHAQF_007233 [Verticillium nonalfalfae]